MGKLTDNKSGAETADTVTIEQVEQAHAAFGHFPKIGFLLHVLMLSTQLEAITYQPYCGLTFTQILPLFLALPQLLLCTLYLQLRLQGRLEPGKSAGGRLVELFFGAGDRFVGLTILVLTTVLVIAFAGTYHNVSICDQWAFSELLSPVSAVYFTMTTLSTVGFGDIVAKSSIARVLVSAQMLLTIVYALLIGGVFLSIITRKTIGK